MPSYYQNVIGNLIMGDIAKSSDIHHIQRHIQDALKALLNDMHDGESYILGSDETYKNSFILKAAPKESGEYIDSSNIFNVLDGEGDFININYNDVKQPILKTKTSLYSIVTNLRNTSNKDIPVTFELQDDAGNVLRSNTVTLEKNNPSANYEIVFDLDFYPTPPNLDFDSLVKRDGKDIPPKTKEESFDEGYDEEHNSEESEKNYFTAGISKLYFVIKRTNLNAIDLVDSKDEKIEFDPQTSLGVYCQSGSLFPDKDIYVETNSGGKDEFEISSKRANIYYKDIYAKEMTYLCSGGSAIIQGERVECLDTHVSIEGGSDLGNVVTQVYLGSDGHLHTANKKASFSTDIESFENDPDDPIPPENLPIALILTYSNAQYGTAKEPLIIQNDFGQNPRSHHERLRRLEKQMDWSNDIALPSRIKYTVSDGDWVDKDGDNIVSLPNSVVPSNGQDIEKINPDNIFITSDENGNLVVKLSNSVPQTIPITLKEKLTNSDGKKKELAETNILNASSFATIEHMIHDSKKGTLELDKETKTKNDESAAIAKTAADAKVTKYNLWDDSAANRPKGKNIEKHEREYKVVSGKNGEHDKNSYYPGMTFYTKTNYKMKKLYIPIHKFHNCSSVKFFIWKRQENNNKKNTVWLQKLYSSKTFSLKKAKVKGKYQYMDEGFTIDFGKGGLSLPKGQYVIIALPIPKSGTGSLFVETYKPKNSKDFCIKYVGAANASHFRLSERYQEVWYNSALATFEEEKYYKKGKVISNTLKFSEKSLERIIKVKPVVDNNLTINGKSKDSYELSVDTGGGWVKVTPNQENVINKGGATTFKWKLEFKGSGDSTPKLSYNSKKGYAIKFILTRALPASYINEMAVANEGKTMCLTSKSFNGDEILRDYLGDINFGLDHSRFEGYEFARIWADNNLNNKLLVDIQGSDKSGTYTSGQKEIDFWTYHYCDLTLDDFEKTSVDYSDYTPQLEYDENNLRLKLDSEHSYNDDDIQLLELHEFTKVSNDIDSNVEDKTLTLVNKETVENNQVFLKKVFETPLDLTQFTGLKFKFQVDTEVTASMIVKGLAIYMSNTEEEKAPSNTKYLPENVFKEPLKDTQIIPKTIDPDESSYSYYEGKLIRILHEIDPKKDGNKIYRDGFYQYIKVFDKDKGKYIYKLEQVFDLRNYVIYEIGEITSFDKNKEFEVRIEIDQDSNNLKHVKEIGIMTLNDEEKYKVDENSIQTRLSAVCNESGKIVVSLKDKNNNPLVGKRILCGENETFTTNNSGEIEKSSLTGTNTITFKYEGEVETLNEQTDEKRIFSASSLKLTYNFSNGAKTITEDENSSKYATNTQITLKSVRGISEENLKIYNPATDVFISNKTNGSVTIHKSGEIILNSTTYGDTSGSTDFSGKLTTNPYTTQININHKHDGLNAGDTLCYINNPYQGGLTKYKHLGIQLASDVYIPKDCIKINICSEANGVNPIASVNLPTLNGIYYPNNSGKNINLSQIFKKIDIGDEPIKSISITITPYFKEALKKVVNSDKPAINLFIGKIVLYRARTIPMYHNKMRFKFYRAQNGEIEHFSSEVTEDDIVIRKIGAVLDYD